MISAHFLSLPFICHYLHQIPSPLTLSSSTSVVLLIQKKSIARASISMPTNHRERSITSISNTISHVASCQQTNRPRNMEENHVFFPLQFSVNCRLVITLIIFSFSVQVRQCNKKKLENLQTRKWGPNSKENKPRQSTTKKIDDRPLKLLTQNKLILLAIKIRNREDNKKQDATKMNVTEMRTL